MRPLGCSEASCEKLAVHGPHHRVEFPVDQQGWRCCFVYVPHRRRRGIDVGLFARGASEIILEHPFRIEDAGPARLLITEDQIGGCLEADHAAHCRIAPAVCR